MSKYKIKPSRLVIGLLIAALWLNPQIILTDEPKNTPDILEADNLTYNESDEVMTAMGNIRYADASFVILADFLQYDAKKEILTAQKISSISILNFNQDGQTATLYAREIIYEKNKDTFTAKGQVKLLFDSNTFQGDFLEYIKSSGKIKLESQIKLHTKDDKKIDGEVFVYDIDKKEGQIANFTYNFIQQDVVYFTQGKSLTYNDRETIIHAATVTTCADNPPHYHFYTAKSIYYPKEKIVFYNNAYWHGNKKRFRTSKTVVGLHNDEPVLPTAGYSWDEGWYVKFRDYYNLSGRDYGFIYKDIMSLRGIGLGFREYHYGKNSREDEFSLYGSYNFLNCNKSFRGDWRSSQKGREQMVSFESKNALAPEEGRQFQSNWSFLASNEFVQTMVNADYFSNSGANGYSYLSGSVHQSIKHTNELRTFWNYNIYTNNYQNNQKFNDRNYSVRMEYTKPRYIADLSLTENKYGYDYSPKLTYRTTLESAFQFGFSTARVRQNYSNLSVQQTDFSTTFRSKIKKLGNNTFFMTNASAVQTLFSDSHCITNYQTNTTLLKNISSQYYLSAAILLGQARGFDSISKYHLTQDLRKINLEANYIFNEDYRMSAGLIYDFTKRHSESFLLNLEGRTFPFWDWMLSLDYNARINRLNTVGTTLTLNQDSGFTGYVKVNYDPNLKAIQEASVRVEKDMGKKWSFSVKSDYLRDGGVLNISEIQLMRKFHCQDYVLSVYPYERIFFIEVKLKNAL